MRKALGLAATACAVSAGTPSERRFPLHLFASDEFLSQNDIAFNDVRDLVYGATATLQSQSDGTLIACGPLDQLKSKREEIIATTGINAGHVGTFFQSKRDDTGCLSMHATPAQAESAGLANAAITSEGAWGFVQLPGFLKLDASVMAYLHCSQSSQGCSVGPRGDSSVEAPKYSDVRDLNVMFKDGLSLSRAREIIKAGVADLESSGLKLPSWLSMKKTLEARGVVSADSCNLDALTLHKLRNGARIANVHELSLTCLMRLAELFASNPDVISVSIGTAPVFFNYAKGQVQSGTPRVEPFTEAGLTGKGQIVAVCDTGIDDLSCFFAEESCAPDAEDHSDCLIPRDGTPYPNRRKVIQYTPYADITDYVAGHGSHVAGTVAGSSLLFDNIVNECGSANGIAPDAQLVIQDIGDNEGNLAGYEDITMFDDILPNAYNAGARIHSNSWGTGALYDAVSRDVDKYLYQNPDVLVVVAASNNGNFYNEPFVVSPASAKNALTVGASQLRDSFSDRDFQATGEDNGVTGAKGTIALFSSNGPAAGNRIKPDVVASGHPTLSARSVGWSGYYNAIDFADYSPSCSVYPQSGTSMAAPLVAGTAALVRQYFQDSDFWAAECDSTYSTCRSGSFTPSGYLLKALMIHSGHPMERYGSPSDSYPVMLGQTPDVFQGYGQVNLSNVLPLDSLEDKQAFKLYVHDALSLRTGESYSWSVVIPNTPSSLAVPLKVTMSYFDPEDSLVMGTLVHNLDLVVVNPLAVQSWGNRMYGGDEFNNNEQVEITDLVCVNGMPCTYNIFVTGVSISMNETQSFAIAITTSAASIVSEPIKIGTSIPVIDPPARDTAVVETIVDDSSMEVYSVYFPDTVLSSENASLSVSWAMTPSTRVSTILIEIHNWNRTDVCPIVIDLNITAPNGNSYSVSGWPYNFASCFYHRPFNLYHYSSLQGVDLSNLQGSGQWRADIGLDNSTSSSATIPIPIEMSIRFTSLKPALELKPVSVPKIWAAPASNKAMEFKVEDLPECTYLAYAEVSIDVIQGYCETKTNDTANNVKISLTDSSSRIGFMFGTYNLDWNPMVSGKTYRSVEYLAPARLNGTGIYNLIYTVPACLANASISVNLHYAAYTESTCLLYSPSDSYYTSPEPRDGVTIEHEIPFDVVLSSCNVPEPSYIGDGWCDNTGNYNTRGCSFDGGDCCYETCVDTQDFRCGLNGYDCVDPSYSDDYTLQSPGVSASSTSMNPGYVTIAEFQMEGALESISIHLDSSTLYSDRLGTEFAIAVTDPDGRIAQIGGTNGFYDENNTYSVALPMPWGFASSEAYYLNASRDVSYMGLHGDELDSDVYNDTSTCLVRHDISYIGDGYCDDDFNNKHCNYDGGDCCERSCVSTEEYTCGSNGYRCLDSRYKFWTVGVFIGNSSSYYPEVHFRGSVTLRVFNGSDLFPVSAEPTAVPTRSPSRSPTRLPTMPPTSPPAEVLYISYDVYIALESVNCNALDSDENGLESVRRTSRDVLLVADSEVQYDDAECDYVVSDTVYPTVADVSLDININNLGYSDPAAAYAELNRRLQESIDSGVFLSKLQGYADTLVSPSLQAVTNVSIASTTMFTVDTQDSAESDSELGAGAIAGVVIGVVVGVGIAAAVVYFIWLYPRNRNSMMAKNSMHISKADSALAPKSDEYFGTAEPVSGPMHKDISPEM